MDGIHGTAQTTQKAHIESKHVMRSILTLAVLLIQLLTGCTTVYVRSDDGTQITVTRNIGFTHISSNLTAEGKGSLIYKATGLGLLVSPRGGTLGWVDETTALIGDASRCQMIVWIDSNNSLEQLKDLLILRQISPDRLCMVAPKAQTQP